MLATLTFAASLAAAQPGAPRASDAVRWQAPTECPGEAVVRARVDQMLAAGGSGRREPVNLRMIVDRTATGFRLQATLVAADGPSGERVVEATRCDDLADAAVLIAAIAIDPDLVPPAADPEIVEPPPPVDDPEPVPEPIEPPRDPIVDLPPPVLEAAPRDDATRRDRNAGSIAPVIDFGAGIGIGRLAIPRPMALVRVGAGVELAWFRALARVSGFGPSFGDVAGSTTGGVFGAFTGGVAACGRTLGTPWSFVGCLATDVGVAAGVGRNTMTTRNNSSIWWGLELELGFEYALTPRWSLAARADAAYTPVRTRFVVDGEGLACCERWGVGVRFGALTRFGPR